MYETWLRSFHAVALTNGFTSAAKSLNLSQPTVTEQVKLLENSFGVELFFRSGRTVRLTEIGQSLFSITTNIVGHHTEAIALLQSQKKSAHGRIAIGSVSPYDIMLLVKLFQSKFDGLTPRVTVSNRKDLLQQLVNFEIDIAIIGRKESDKRIVNVPYKTLPVCVLISAQHEWAERMSITTADLENAPMILREEKSTTRAKFESAMKGAGVPYRVIMEINNREAIREAVKLDLGYGLVSNDSIDSLPKEQFRAMPVADADMQIQLHIAYLKNRESSPIISSFIDTAFSL